MWIYKQGFPKAGKGCSGCPLWEVPQNDRRMGKPNLSEKHSDLGSQHQAGLAPAINNVRTDLPACALLPPLASWARGDPPARDPADSSGIGQGGSVRDTAPKGHQGQSSGRGGSGPCLSLFLNFFIAMVISSSEVGVGVTQFQILPQASQTSVRPCLQMAEISPEMTE